MYIWKGSNFDFFFRFWEGLQCPWQRHAGKHAQSHGGREACGKRGEAVGREQKWALRRCARTNPWQSGMDESQRAAQSAGQSCPGPHWNSSVEPRQVQVYAQNHKPDRAQSISLAPHLDEGGLNGGHAGPSRLPPPPQDDLTHSLQNPLLARHNLRRRQHRDSWNAWRTWMSR